MISQLRCMSVIIRYMVSRLMYVSHNIPKTSMISQLRHTLHVIVAELFGITSCCGPCVLISVFYFLDTLFCTCWTLFCKNHIPWHKCLLYVTTKHLHDISTHYLSIVTFGRIFTNLLAGTDFWPFSGGVLGNPHF